MGAIPRIFSAFVDFNHRYIGFVQNLYSFSPVIWSHIIISYAGITLIATRPEW
jgi:hypothetical protein